MAYLVRALSGLKGQESPDASAELTEPPADSGALQLATLARKLAELLKSRPELAAAGSTLVELHDSGCLPKPLASLLPLRPDEARSPRRCRDERLQREQLAALAQLLQKAGIGNRLPVMAPAEVEVRRCKCLVDGISVTCLIQLV